MNQRPSFGRLQGKVAIVTGSSRGIGKAIALGYAREGAMVVLTGRDQSTLETVAEEVVQVGTKALPVRVDVTQPEDVEEMVERTLAVFGRVDILVNNAGIPLVAPSEGLDLNEWRKVIDTNLTGVFLCSQAVARPMLRQGSGCIINIGSLTSFVGFPKRLAYASTKTAVLGVTRVLAVEWARQGIRVNAIAPGWIRTDLMQSLIARGVLDPDKLIARTPMGRLGEVDDIVGPAIFLASDEAAFITGQTLVVDGGWLAYGYV